MNVTNCFEQLIEHAKRSSLPRGFQADIISSLTYFRTQSLCDLDRRDSPVQLRDAWKQFRGQVRGLNFLESFKDGDENFWRIVQCFVYEYEPASLIIPKKDPPPEKPPSKFAKWEPLDFFNYMGKQVEARPAISEAERLFVLHGLWYLSAEAGRAKGQRNDSRISIVWKSIHPYLEKMGFMVEFSSEYNLIYSVKLFLGNLSVDKSK